jgi:hypothetical protein
MAAAGTSPGMTEMVLAEFTLIPHPAAPSATVERITAIATRPSRDTIALTYRIHGALDAIRWPDPAAPEFAHELWMHTCFEAFIAGEGDFYRELNLSPSTRYAIYDFNGYRGVMRDAGERDIRLSFDRDTAMLSAEVAMPALAEVAEWRLGLTTVIEDASGAKSFWALHHPRTEPDFHNQAGFVARLAAPASS